LKSHSICGYNFWLTPMDDYGIILTPLDSELNPAIIAQAIQDKIAKRKSKYVKEVIATSEEIFIATHNYKKAIKEIVAIGIVKKVIKKWRVPIFFDAHKDWKELSYLTGLSKEVYIQQLLRLKITVAMLGFLPGFVYAKGLAKEMQVARKKIPERNTFRNMLATGGPYLGIYSLPSPSGWYTLGKIPVDILNLDNNVPIPFAIEDRLVFESISEGDFEKMVKQKINIITYNA